MRRVRVVCRTPLVQWGYSLSVDADTLVIGAPGHQNGFGIITGAAFVYDRLSIDNNFRFRQASS